MWWPVLPGSKVYSPHGNRGTLTRQRVSAPHRAVARQRVLGPHRAVTGDADQAEGPGPAQSCDWGH